MTPNANAITVNSLPAAGFVGATTAGSHFELSRSAWYRLARAGKVPPPRRIGALLRWSVDDLRRFADGRWTPEEPSK